MEANFFFFLLKIIMEAITSYITTYSYKNKIKNKK